MEKQKRIISIYSEATPNPETMKFVMNKMLYMRNSIDFQSADEVNGAAPFADALFSLPFVRGVFISNNFVTVTRVAGNDWNEIIPEIKNFISAYLQDEKPVINEEILTERKGQEAKEVAAEVSEDDQEIVQKIKDLLQKYVQPAVEMDGGSIVFKNFNAGTVTLGMQGACSGCPSSTVTLKNGIEGMMKRMIPEVTEVVAEAV